MAKGDIITDKSIREFQRALREYEAATGKNAAEVLNRAGGNAALRSAQFTEKATLADMRATNAYDPQRRPANDRTRYTHALFAKKTGRPGSSGEVRKFFAKRRGSRGYISAGFLPAARDFGRPTRQRLIRGGDASLGSGKKARATNLTALINNYSDGADTVGARGFNRALSFVSRDMLEHAARVMQKTANKHSAR